MQLITLLLNWRKYCYVKTHRIRISYLYNKYFFILVWGWRQERALSCFVIWQNCWTKRNHGKNNCRITAWLRWERTFGGHLVESPCSSRAIYSQLPRNTSRWLLNISKDGGSATPLGNLCPVTLTAEKLFPDVRREPHVFHFVSVASRPVPGHHWEESSSIFFAPSLQVFIHIDEVPLEPALLQAEQPQLSQPLLIAEMLQSLVARF